ncbi:chondroitin sulfate synthase 1-like [Gigantopelta aegis]|uniref:chondroitin sulfate synthase 1-like n=1 Tax=Gigantopelta aegis TaxID=1735272 RepID=UPI001B889CF6|nr:chondroitin sulfate synthase 1-like [Gigantopelta aegis]
MKRQIPIIVYLFYGICFGIIIYSKWLTHVRINSKLNPRACLLENNLDKQTVLPVKERDFLIVGIVTSRESLNTLVLTMYKTWAKRIPGKVIFFIGKGPAYVGDLPVVSLGNILGDVYPQRFLGLATLEYMFREYGQAYEWFLRAEDDIFINVSNLELFLKSLDSSKPKYIGQPGLFKPNETGDQNVGPTTPFCMGGPGVILSRKSMDSLGPGLSECLKPAVTSHEDTELGRCVYNIVGIHCTASYQMSNLFYQIRNESTIHPVQTALLSALTIHPFNNSSHVYKLQIVLQEQVLRQRRIKIAKLRNEVSRVSNQIYKTITDNNRSGTDLFISSANNEWSFIQSGKYYSRKHSYQKPWSGLRFKGRQSDLNTAVVETYRHITSTRIMCYVLTRYAYEHLTPSRGLMHVLTLKCNNSRRRLVLVQKTFDSPVVEEHPNLQDIPLRLKNNIYIVLFIHNQLVQFLRFLRHLISISGAFRGGIYVCVAVQRDIHNDHNKVLNYSSQYSKMKNIHINVSILQIGERHQKGIHRCINSVPKHGLILWTDPGVVFTAGFLNRLLLNTVEKKQVYFPITFSAFNRRTICYKKKMCNNTLFNLEEERGMWRYFGFGTMGIYKSDLVQVTTFNRSNKDLGHEGTELYNDFLQSYLHIFRTVDPGITLLNDDTKCTFNILQSQTDACRKLTYTFFGSQTRLAEMYLDHINSANNSLQ